MGIFHKKFILQTFSIAPQGVALIIQVLDIKENIKTNYISDERPLKSVQENHLSFVNNLFNLVKCH